MTCDIAKLKRQIDTHWRKRLGWEDYLTDLLPQEMACALADDPSRLPSTGCDLLVLLVGYSWEPLFQSVWTYRPNRVLLILNEHYGLAQGIDQGKEIRRLLTETLAPLAGFKLETKNVICETVAGTDKNATQNVFQTLLNRLKGDITTPTEAAKHPLVIDITGAKKSMVAGAFLFAAYTGVPVSYVDFDDAAYNDEYGKPYGYACRIGEIANPYQSFALRDWEQLRTLYTRYNFRGSQQILTEKIKPAMAAVLPAEQDKIKRLTEIFIGYELWDNGDFSGAKLKMDTLRETLPNFSPPTAVETLGQDGYWPHSENPEALLTELDAIEFGRQDVSQSLYLSPERLLTYAWDEINRIERLIHYNEDYRSALLRAASLWEVLLRARVVGLWHNGLLDVAMDSADVFYARGEAPEEIKEWEEEIGHELVMTSSGVINIPPLRFKEGGGKRKGLKIDCCRNRGAPAEQNQLFYLRRNPAAPLLADSVAAPRDRMDNNKLQTLRHKAAHTYLSVSKSIAVGVWQSAKVNLEDFVDQWVGPVWRVEPNLNAVITERLPWSQLCRLAGLDFLPANLQQDEIEKEVV